MNSAAFKSAVFLGVLVCELAIEALFEMSEAPIEAYDKEALVQRNPHADFPAIEATRPNYDPTTVWNPTKTPKPSWKPGDGASMNGWYGKPMVAIDPHQPGRTSNQNYKLMISTTVPRPIALVSTISADGKRQNLAPYSYCRYWSRTPSYLRMFGDFLLISCPLPNQFQVSNC